ncbi:MAG: glycerate kinase [Bacteroidota bacterium]
MRYLIATDSFKDALPAAEVCAAIERGLKLADPTAQTIQLPLADGGEGTAKVLTQLTGGEGIACQALGPLGPPIEAWYGWQAETKTAFIDMAAASGLQLLEPKLRNPMLTSTFGTGQLIKDAIDRGARKIILGIGGSATNDGGMGMATALGHEFRDANDSRLSGMGANLLKVSQWFPSRMKIPPVEVLCDVDNPLCGPGRGAAYVYGPQKGATPEQVQALDKGLQQLADVVRQKRREDFATVPGAGAAGGLGFGALAFLKASLQSGIQTVLEYANFDQHLQQCDYVITGEGKLDDQTLQGKLIQGICSRALAQSKPVIALCGAMLASPEAINAIGLEAAFSIQSQPRSLAEALQHTAEDLAGTAFQVGRLLKA